MGVCAARRLAAVVLDRDRLGVIVFSVTLGWVPASGYVALSDDPGRWFAALIEQPACVLALFQIGYLARMTRSAMLDVLGQDYIRTARAKGVGGCQTIIKHGLRNALIPVVTVSGIILSPVDRRLGGGRTGVRAARHRAHDGAGHPGPRLSAGPGNDAALRVRLRPGQRPRRRGLHGGRSTRALLADVLATSAAVDVAA